jgi:hypothetical protein
MSRRRIAPSLTDAYLKTSRAKVHLDALGNELDMFRKSKPCSIFRKDNLKTGRYEIRVKVATTPDSIPLILGDCLYCLRSSLDQAVWSLAKLRVPYPEGTQFPILDTNNAKTRKTFSRYTANVPAGALRLIKSLQPYHRADPSAHLLWRLNCLCNIDKHRRIPVHGDELIVHFPGMRRPLMRFVEFDHAQQMTSVPLAMKANMAFDPEVSFDVVFGDMSQGISCDFDGLTDIYNFVAKSVLPQFARFFA